MYWYDYVGIQITFFIMVTQLYLMYMLHTQPFKNFYTNVHEFLNELTIILVSYLCLLLTDYITFQSAKVKFNVGWGLMTVVGMNIFVGLGNIFVILFKQVRRKILRRMMLKRNKKIMKMLIKKYSPFA